MLSLFEVRAKLPRAAPMRRPLFRLFIPCLLLVAATAFAAPLEQPFSWQARVEPATVAPGGGGALLFSLTAEPDHFAYGDMTGVALTDAGPVVAGEVVPPKGEWKDDPFGDERREIFTGTVTYRIPFTVPADVKPGTYTLTAQVRHQGCSETVCFFPEQQTLAVPLQVGTGEAAGTPAPAAGSSVGGGGLGFAATLERGYLVAFAIVFAAGVATSLTPCVYPLIPITVGIFGASAATSRARAFGLSLVYVLGMAAMYSALGLAAAATGQVFGQAVSSPVFIAVIAVVFGAFGLSMLGVFEIRIPTRWQTALTAGGKAGPAGAFVMGLVAGVVAAPCTGPVLGAVLAYVATTGSLVLGFTLLFVFALGMGLLFVALGTFAGLAARMPRSGPWMDTVKAVLGVLMLAMVLYFLRLLAPPLEALLGRTPDVFLVAVALLAVGWRLGAYRGSFQGLAAARVPAKLLAVALSVVGAYMIVGSLMLPPVPAEARLAWRTDLEAARADAKAAGKPVMIDFVADWCVECKLLAAETFADPAVAPRLDDFVLVQVDLTHDTPRTKELRDRYGIPGLPYVVFVGRDGKVRPELTLTGFEPPAKFLARLERVSASGSDMSPSAGGSPGA